ncbi:hypothetical protein BMJ34_20140 [Sinorhizobium medicae]|uniref:Uncharacterized protein n=1 Tax=Sinorhizobium medicae TaxID=110321 RepID=A0ABX4TCL9_9HYPH|nr:hypothetical protein BMJ33_32340 [Sinorhizobium medicae]PLT95724.1 hypothetical protein BMJ34_20140 [Sinorhizobium medicae]PLU12091.1 hypothetical protein BMJ29_33440 [Sinorhizobium medicae]PLU23134.1 hypothetical protein BMJ30_03245 [Sinorhizobium medicae]PLU36663.1 hypothetical protein BMJ27_09820 [Sinorhizobium medicae]
MFSPHRSWRGDIASQPRTAATSTTPFFTELLIIMNPIRCRFIDVRQRMGVRLRRMLVCPAEAAGPRPFGRSVCQALSAGLPATYRYNRDRSFRRRCFCSSAQPWSFSEDEKTEYKHITHPRSASCSPSKGLGRVVFDAHQ